MQTDFKNRWPLPAALHFVPGGSVPTGDASHLYYLNGNSDAEQQRLMQVLTKLARSADEDLKAIGGKGNNGLSISGSTGSAVAQSMEEDEPVVNGAEIFLPSLSVLAEAVFHPLCGCNPNRVKQWADTMVLCYHALDENSDSSVDTDKGSLVRLLKSMSAETEHALPPRPCGYVFKRGDMAWNCRTCQTDSTCVLCDTCFQASDHRGHEVSFHRTSPGGCCDCGDIEAWAREGCCDKHRPLIDDINYDNNSSQHSSQDTSLTSMLEAVYSCQKSRQKGEEAARELPSYLRASLALVIGAAVNTIVDAIDGASIGADLSQSRLRLAEEVCRLRTGCVHDDDAIAITFNESDDSFNPHYVLSNDETIVLPHSYALNLRLHNDDVHTFEEVIEALHMSRRRRDNTTEPLQEDIFVPDRARAEHMTQLVDSDGQVIVKEYHNFTNAVEGFQQLKRQGLHCAIVSSSQLSAEDRARHLLSWLADISAAHPGVAALVCHALVDVTGGDELFAGVHVWPEPRQVPCWAGVSDGIKRFQCFPVEESSSYLTRENARTVYEHGLELDESKELQNTSFVECTGSWKNFYKLIIPWKLPSKRLRKSPHSLWGILNIPQRRKSGKNFRSKSILWGPTFMPVVSDRLLVIDTDTCKHQQTDLLLSSLYPHELPGLYAISGITATQKPAISEELKQFILSVATFRSPSSPLLLMLLLDPYPPKNLRSAIHSLFLSLIIDLRFKSRLGAALGSVAYRPLSTLFCAGVGTEADTPLGFSVQILTTGSLVQALSSSAGAVALLESDALDNNETFEDGNKLFCSYALPIDLTITRAVHSNLLGASKEVKMVLKNIAEDVSNSILTPLLYQTSEHPALNCLPAARDDEFLDSRSTRHKRLPHLLKDLQYVLETPGTALRLMLGADDTNEKGMFPAMWCRLLRMAQDMNSLKRKTSGGHIEYEHRDRWLDAFKLSLGLAGTRDALCETMMKGAPYQRTQQAMSNLVIAILHEIKYWLYGEGVLETGLHLSSQERRIPQRSTLHTSDLQLDCARQFCVLESQFDDLEKTVLYSPMQNWLRVPHSPYYGDALSFHIPLHRAVAKCVLAMCAVPVSLHRRQSDINWWHIPVLDCSDSLESHLMSSINAENCRVTWQNYSNETYIRQTQVAVKIATAKVLHSLADHPLRCIAASMQIERHIWPRNGITVLQMAIHYGTLQLCRAFRDLDMTLVQYIAAKDPSVILSLILNRFSMEGYLCDLQRNSGENGTWIKPPYLHDSSHAPVLAEAVFTTLCHLVTELPPMPACNEDDTSILERAVKRELVHGLATEAKSYSEASDTALAGVEMRVGEVPDHFREVLSHTLKSVAIQKASGGSNSAPQWSLKPNCEEIINEYDPTFWHISRQDHQGAMETIAGLRKTIYGSIEGAALPLVQEPPQCHPRFTRTRDILHTEGLDAAVRRFLLYCVSGGDWLPSLSTENEEADDASPTDKHIQSNILEVLQILTLQIHTCSDVKNLINRLVFVPPSLEECKLSMLSRIPTVTSGRNRTSILGLVVALFEHGYSQVEDSQTNGARSLVSSGVKWYLRCIWYLCHGFTLPRAKEFAYSGTMQSNGEKCDDMLEGMLALPELWIVTKPSEDLPANNDAKKKAQMRALQRMKALQQNFAKANQFDMSDSEDEEETCIICRLGSANGCLGHLGHLQSSRVAFMNGVRKFSNRMVVVGVLGCQLRQDICTDSPKVALLPMGSIVELISHKLHGKRVQVRLVDSNITGFASLYMQGGTPILSYLDEVGLSKWGYSRPVLKLCGHVAHTACVEAHTLSLHQRHAADLPFDGRYAVNLENGEYLCPLCKRLCNIVCPILPSVPQNSVKASGGTAILRIEDHLCGVVLTAMRENDTNIFVSRVLSTLHMDGANMIAIPILGACVGYAAYHNIEDVQRIHECVHSTMSTETRMGSVRGLSKILHGTSLLSVSREELRYLSRQWCHIGGVEIPEEQHSQWKRCMDHLLLSKEVKSLPEWSKDLKNIDNYCASVWSYIPILGWDLTSLAGILFSTITKRNKDIGIDIASTLISARFVQIISLPQNFYCLAQKESKLDHSKIAQNDISVLEGLRNGPVNLDDIVQCMIPFAQVLSNLLRIICDINDLPPFQNVWEFAKHLNASPSMFDLILISKWRQQLSTLQKGLVLERDSNFVKVIENAKTTSVDGSVELAKPSSEEDDDMSMGSHNGSKIISQTGGFLSAPTYDLSYLGLRFSSEEDSLIKLPDSFVTLYSMISNMQLLSSSDQDPEDSAADDSDEEYSSSGREIAVCMITGEVMLAGSNSRGMYYNSNNSPGRCTIHAKKNGAGVGIFFLLQKCAVLLLHNDKSAYSPSLYVDEHGEEDVGLRRGRPLYLHQERFQRLQKLWLQHDIPGEVARIRSTSDRVIRDNWY